MSHATKAVHVMRRATRKAENDERDWWTSADDAEPLVGVPSVASVPVPLPDTAPDEPEPGIEPEQEADIEGLGFEFSHPGED